jgi:hypothetical protein
MHIIILLQQAGWLGGKWVDFYPMDSHHKLTISWNFNQIREKIIKWYVCVKLVSLKVLKWYEKYAYYFFINDMSFLIMMSWCEVCTICILTKSV